MHRLKLCGLRDKVGFPDAQLCLFFLWRGPRFGLERVTCGPARVHLEDPEGIGEHSTNGVCGQRGRYK